MSTHAQNLRVYEVWSEVVGLREGDRYLIVNPFFHGFGYKAGWFASIMRGATIVPDAGVRRARGARPKVQAERITVLPGPPTLLSGILEFPDRDRYDLSTLRLTVTGAAVVPVELIRRLRSEMSLRDDHHRLRAHRDDRHRLDVPLRRRSRDHRQRTPGARSPTPSCASSTSRATRSPAASRVRS